MNDGATATARNSLKSALLLTALTAGALLPFVTKPFHLDDPITLWVAEQIRRDPLDFYGFDANWYGVAKPMHEMAKNPPGVSYYAAMVSSLFGTSEVAMHGAFLLFAVAAVLGTFFLAREMGMAHWPATAAAAAMLFAPVFLVSASSVMLDVPMLALFVWAVWAWVAGMRRDRAALRWLAVVLTVMAALSKYFAVSLLPLFLVYGLLQRRRAGRWLIPLLLPVAVLAFYELQTQRMYGRGLLLDAADYATQFQDQARPSFLLPLLTGLSFAGGGCISVLLILLPAARSRSLVTGFLTLFVVTVLLLVIDPYPRAPIKLAAGEINSGLLLHLSLFVASAVIVLVSILRTALRDLRDPEAVLLALWVLGTFAFAAVFNWSVNGRSMLAIAPPLALLAARSVAARGIFERRRQRSAIVAALMISAALSLLVVRADAAHARAARRAAHAIHQRYNDRPGQVWFTGHWGFQYYMEQLGARAIDPANPGWQVGDLLVQPRNNPNTFRFDGPDLPIIFRFGVPALNYLATMDPAVHAGFYADLWGPLPFAFGQVPPDQYIVMEIRGPIRPILGVASDNSVRRALPR